MGPHTQEYLDALDRRSLSLQAILDAEQKATPDLMQAGWNGSDGEAGDFVELNAGGGILGFNISRDDGARSLICPTSCNY